MLYKLSDIFDLQMGKTPSRDNNMYWKDGNLPWVSIADLSKSQIYIENSKEMITNLAAKDTSMKCIPQDTVIMSFKLSLGKTAITKTPLYTNEAIMAFVDKKIIQIEPKYIYFLFSNIKWGQYTNNAVKGKTLNKKFFSDFQIYIPEYIQQTKIASILIRINKILEYKHSLIKAYDALIKSRFVEMFEVFNINPNNYNTIKFKDLIERNNINEEDKVWLLNLDMIKPNTGEIVEKVYINRQNIPASSISFKKGTVLYSKLRPYLNKVVIADENGYGTSELIPLNSYKNGLTAEYLAYYLRQDSFVDYIKDKVTGAKMPRVAMDILRNIDIIQPNYIYQEQFSSFVNHVNKLKSDVQKSIDETQLLMDSLMQEYFG